MNTRTRKQYPLTKHFSFILGFLLALATQSLWACSDVLIIGNTCSKPLPVVSARTMDFTIDLKSVLVKVPRGMRWASNAVSPPDPAKSGVTWSNQYGFVGLNMLDQTYKFSDGINEKGLSVGILWLSETEFPDTPGNTQALSIQDFAAWALGQFQSVAEVKVALTGANPVVVWGEFSQELQAVPPVHAVLHDAYGKSLVIEWLNKKMNVYDDGNQFNGVMTNSPSYPLQLQNLADSKYAQLQCGNVNNEEGLLGIPGDMSSKSRFVLLSKLSQCVTHELVGNKQAGNPLLNENDTLQAAAHLIGRVERAKGESWDIEPPQGVDYAQWALLRVHGLPDQNGKSTSKLYFRSADNHSLRLIELANLDFSMMPQLTTADLQAQWLLEDPGYLKAQNLTPSPTECLFNWAEKVYSAFPTHPATQVSKEWIYRYYSGINTYLGVSQVDNHVYYKNPSGQLQDEGALLDWLYKAGCQ